MVPSQPDGILKFPITDSPTRKEQGRSNEQMTSTQYDLLVVGGGPGGYVAAIRASQLGLRTALVEKEDLGGVCLNWGCIPTKSLLRNAEVLSLFKRADEFGISVTGLTYDFSKAILRSRTVVKRLTTGIGSLLRNNKVDYISGYARLLDDNTLAIDSNSTATLVGKNIILATGARPKPIPSLDIDGKTIITSREALEIKEVPSSITIIGGGATGVEFAYLYRTYGAEVTIVEAMPRLLPNEDEEISRELQRSFTRQGINTILNARVIGVNRASYGVDLTVNSTDINTTITSQTVLIAAGLEGNTESIGLSEAGIDIYGTFIQVNERMQTTIPNVYAIGDVTGKMPLAHVASAQALLAVETIAGLESPLLEYDKLPRATYCFPQVTSFGYTETQARNKGLDISVGRFPFRANGKALAMGESEGLTKIIADNNTGKILGAHLIGPEVTEILPEIIATHLLNGTAQELGWLVHSHPSLSETVKEAAMAAFGQFIHI